MVKFKEKIVITSGLPYANGELHLGHVASTYLPADIFARYCRLKGREVEFVCATDDFGTPILVKAEKEGKKPEDFVAFWNRKDKQGLDALGVSVDAFDRTSSKENGEFVQKFFLALQKKGFIFKREVELPYCEKCRKFLPDRYVKGTCKYCGADEQYSDGCEKCGRVFDPADIINPHCAICGTTPVKKKSEHYFFKLSAFGQKLKEWMDGNDGLQPDVKNYVLKWIENGLLDWDITRDISWGVPIPLDEAKGKVLYGWFDNHLCYISTLVKHLAKKKIDGKKFWNSAKIYHFIGKDIVYHHYLFLPAVRMGEGNYKLPDFIPVRGHLLLQGRKFSKSRDWYVGLEEFLSAFPADYLRYYLSAITPYGQADVNFDWKEFQARINNELVASIGNFIHRTLTFIDSKMGGKVPKPKKLDEADKEFQKRMETAPGEVEKEIEAGEFGMGLKKIVEFATACNQYFQKKEPWKNEPGACLHLCANAVRTLAVLTEPYLPFAAEDLWKQLGLAGSVHKQKWEGAGELKVKTGHKIEKPHILFAKAEDKDIEERIGKLSA